MALVNLNGVELHTQALGEGPAVAMLHGLMIGSMATWYFSTAHALRSHRRVLLYDLRGHGKSERAARGYDLPTMARDLDAVLAHYGAERASLVGHSYGGLIALHWALAHPDRLDKLVLVDVPLPPTLMVGFHEDPLPGPEELLARLPSELRGAALQGRRQAQRLIDNLLFLFTQSSMVQDVRAALDVSDAALAGLNRPVLCIFGKESSCLPAGERLVRALPSARLECVPGGHQVPFEAPAQMTRLITDFL